MEQWQHDLDRWLTTPPEEPESHFFCDGENCGEPFYPDDYVYEIEGMNLCEDCAKLWLDSQKRLVTEGDCEDGGDF